MRLENSKNENIHDPDMNAIREALQKIEGKELNYIILNKDDSSFLQTCLNENNRFDLVYRVNEYGEVMYSFNAFTLEEVTRLFERYISHTRSLYGNLPWRNQNTIEYDEEDEEFGLMEMLSYSGSFIFILVLILVFLGRYLNMDFSALSDLFSIDYDDFLSFLVYISVVLKFPFAIKRTYYGVEESSPISIAFRYGLIIATPIWSVYLIFKLLF